MLYIMRHGQTDWNIVRRFQGQSDIPLNENGKNMARNARDKYQNIHFDVCYSSPLKRAYETAQIFLEGKNVPIIADDRLKEMSFGDYEGIKLSDCVLGNSAYTLFHNAEAFSKLSSDETENVETFGHLYARTGDFLQKVVYPDLQKGKDVLISGHGAMNLSIYNQIKGIEIKDFWSKLMGNCELELLIK